MNTDTAWEAWGKQDPYFGVITDPKFRKAALTPEAVKEFFDSGHVHTDFVMQMIRQHIDPGFQPQTVLEFGCGVGRLVVPFAKTAGEVVGMDISVAMLQEARKNCEAHGVANVRLALSDDDLSQLTGRFDLIHSCIVFQHIPPARGRAIFGRLLQHLPIGGVGAIQFTYSKAHYESTHGIAPPELPAETEARLNQSRLPVPPGADPEMQMNPYNMNELLFLMQRSGVTRFHTEFTDHGGELGVFLFFQKALQGAL